jgi:hypothetical protein
VTLATIETALFTPMHMQILAAIPDDFSNLGDS